MRLLARWPLAFSRVPKILPAAREDREALVAGEGMGQLPPLASVDVNGRI
jgi:hypothetical protein